MKRNGILTFALMMVTMLLATSAACSRKTVGPASGGSTSTTMGTKKKTPAPGATLTYYEYQRSTMRWPPNHYVLEAKEGGGATLFACGWWKSHSFCDTVEVGSEVLTRVAELVLKHGMLDYGTYSPPFGDRILDGYQWWQSIRFSDKTRNYARGNNASPDSEGFNEVHRYLDSIAVAAGAQSKPYDRD